MLVGKKSKYIQFDVFPQLSADLSNQAVYNAMSLRRLDKKDR